MLVVLVSGLRKGLPEVERAGQRVALVDTPFPPLHHFVENFIPSKPLKPEPNWVGSPDYRQIVYFVDNWLWLVGTGEAGAVSA